MSIHKTLATSNRVLSQLRHDHRTIALIFVVPPVLLTLLKYVYDGRPLVFEHIAPMLLGIFPMMMMFLITSIVTLRERSSGTLDRLMTMPITKADFIFGYAIAFCILGLLQAVVASAVMLLVLDVSVMGGALSTIIVAILSAFLGTAMGLFTSAFAKTEFQAVQFLPAFILPQLLLCGLFIVRSEMAQFLHWLSNIMPLTYSVEAMKIITVYPNWTSELTKDLIIVASFAITALILASATIRRKS